LATKDLIGLPLRITVSARSLEQGGVELKRRDQSEQRMVPLAELQAALQGELTAPAA
jgi:prolyl-tRNA synthetase